MRDMSSTIEIWSDALGGGISSFKSSSVSGQVLQRHQ